MEDWYFLVEDKSLKAILARGGVTDELKKQIHYVGYTIEHEYSKRTANEFGELYKQKLSELYTEYKNLTEENLEIQGVPDWEIIAHRLNGIFGEIFRNKGLLNRGTTVHTFPESIGRMWGTRLEDDCRQTENNTGRNMLNERCTKQWSKLSSKEETWIELLKRLKGDVPVKLANDLHTLCWLIENTHHSLENTAPDYDREVANLYTRYLCLPEKYLGMQGKPNWQVIVKGLNVIWNDIRQGELDVDYRVRIHIKSFDERLYDFEINQNETVRAFKRQVSAKAGIPENEFVLRCNETELIDNEALSVFGIRNGSTLNIVPNTRQECLYVKRANGDMHEFYGIDRSETVQAFKRKVSEKLGIQVNEFMLVHNTTELKDNEVLSAVGISNNSTMLILCNGEKVAFAILKFLLNNMWNGAVDIVNGLPSLLTDPSRKLKEEDVPKIAPAIGKGWDMLGYRLGFSRVQMQHIFEDNTRVVMKIVDMLSEWIDKNPVTATVGKLYEAMKDCNVTVDWQEMRKVFAGS